MTGKHVALLSLLPALAFGQVFGGGTFASGGAKSTSPSGGGASAPRTLVGVGDSIMAGSDIPTPLATAVQSLDPGSYFVNAGISGQTSADLAARWLSTESAICGIQRCTHLWLEGGINDLRFGSATPAAVLTNMLTVVDDALARGYVVAWSDILPCRGESLCTEAVIDNVLAYNALMAQACATAPRSLNPRLRCFFAYPTFVDPARFRVDGTTLAGYLLPVYSRDELHLSVAGSQALGALAAQALQE